MKPIILLTALIALTACTGPQREQDNLCKFFHTCGTPSDDSE